MYLSKGACACADLQMVNISLRVLSKPDTEELANIYKARGGARSGMLFRPVFVNDTGPAQSKGQMVTACSLSAYLCSRNRGSAGNVAWQ